MFRIIPIAGLAQLVERWFCNSAVSLDNLAKSRGNSGFPHPSACEIAALSDRNAALKSAQSILSPKCDTKGEPDA